MCPRKHDSFPPALAVVLIALAATTTEVGAARKLRSGDRYESPSKLFTVTVPQVCSPFHLQYEVKESTKRGNQFLEEAALYMPDMGELYKVGVRRLTREMRQQVQQPDGPLAPPALAWLALNIHLTEREKRTGEWRPSSDFEMPQTSFGPAVMSVNHVQGGRFIRESTLDKTGKLVPVGEDPPGEIVVLVVQSGEHVLYVTAQADLGSVECVQREVWKMLDGLKLSRALAQLGMQPAARPFGQRIDALDRELL